MFGTIALEKSKNEEKTGMFLLMEHSGFLSLLVRQEGIEPSTGGLEGRWIRSHGR